MWWVVLLLLLLGVGPIQAQYTDIRAALDISTPGSDSYEDFRIRVTEKSGTIRTYINMSLIQTSSYLSLPYQYDVNDIESISIIAYINYPGVNDYRSSSDDAVLVRTLTVSPPDTDFVSITNVSQRVQIYQDAVFVRDLPPPTAIPTAVPTAEPTSQPTAPPTSEPTSQPTTPPTAEPTLHPTGSPTSAPTSEPTVSPTATPSQPPTAVPTGSPTAISTLVPTSLPTSQPTSLSQLTGHPSTTPITPSLPTTQAPLPSTTVTSEPTLVPASPIPSALSETATRRQFLSEEDRERTKKVTTAGAFVSMGSLSSSGTGLTARVGVLSTFGCSVEDVDIEEAEELDFEFHPTGVAIGGGSRRYIIGAVVMNPTIVLLLLFVLLLVAGLVHLFAGTSWDASNGSLRSPGVLYIPYLFLLQGTSLVAARAVFYPRESVLSVIMGGLVLCLCMASPLLIYWRVIRRVHAECRHIPDPRLNSSTDAQVAGGVKRLKGKKASVYRYVFGPAVWAPTGADSQFVERYGILFEAYKYDKIWFVVCEPSMMVLLSLLSAWRPGSDEVSCDVRNVMITLIFFAFMTAVIFYQPFSAPMDNLIGSTLSIMMFIAVLFMTVGLWAHQSNSGTLYTMAAWCLLITAIAIIIKCTWDAMTYFFDICLLARRKVARKVALLSRRDSAANSIDAELIENQPVWDQLDLSNVYYRMTRKIYEPTMRESVLFGTDADANVLL